MNYTGKAYIYGKSKKLAFIAEVLKNSATSKEIEATLKVDFDESHDETNEWTVESIYEVGESMSWMIVAYTGDNFWAQLSEIFDNENQDEENKEIEIVDYANYVSMETNDIYGLSVKDRYYYVADSDHYGFFKSLTELLAEVKTKFGVPEEMTEKWDIIKWTLLEKDVKLSIEELKLQYHLCPPWTRTTIKSVVRSQE